jgi:Raf kinase inhibitor-like YbhB/YbcL family protein
MKLISNNLEAGQPVPAGNVFAIISNDSATGHVALSANRNPHLAWVDAPATTRSFAIICHDPDVPSRGDDVNQEGREVPADLPRVDFFHWLLWNIPANVTQIAEGTHSDGVTPHGKPGPEAPGGMQHGINDYTGWFAGDADMQGDYYGYDGPCPPWNDAIVHRYIFTVYALDVEKLDVGGKRAGADLRAALEGHVLAEASLATIFTLNPRLAG